MTRTRVAEFEGGSLDGAVRELPAGVGAAVTARRDGGQSHYVLDEDTGGFCFVGFNELGASMAGIIRQSGGAARLEAEAVDQAAELASRPRGCPNCGLTFESEAAFTVAHDPHWPGGCLPPGAAGQLVEVDGVWCLPWSAAGRQ